MRTRRTGRSRGPDFDERLRAKLRLNGVLPDPETYGHVRPAITRLGEAEYERLQSIAGPAFERGIAEPVAGADEAHTTRVPGFGRALTAFVVAPLALPDEQRAAVCELGATANFLVATFDRLAEQGYDPDGLLSPDALRAAASGDRPAERQSDSDSTVAERAMVRLVSHYFDRLASLPGADSRPSVRRHHHRCVREMYAMERRAATGVADEDDHLGRSVYEFVVKGIPGWLATPGFDEDRYEAHLAWLRDLGTFVRLVDDAVDLREDEATGAYNTVAAGRAADGDDATLERIAALGRSVLDDWAEMTPETEHPTTTRHALSTCVGSWFGGVRPR